jgi:hypothetical protein
VSKKSAVIRVVVAASSAIIAATGAAAFAAPSPPTPYSPPPFAGHCQFRHFGEGVAPPIQGYKDDPLCVDYAKRDITLDNGGAVRFTLAEPARFAIAAKPCKYWQVDHWSVQIDRGFTAVVRWDGSYWFDKGRGIGAAVMRNFRIAGQRVGAAQAAAAIAIVSPQLAGEIRTYGRGSGRSGGGASFNLGGGDPQCPSR